MSELKDLARPFKPSLVHAPAQGKYGDYVSHDAVTQKLLAVVGPFSYELMHVILDGEIVTGAVFRLTVTVDGQEVSVEEVGDVENPAGKKTNGARMKDAASDAIKRCAMRIGVGLHLWADEYFLYDVLKAEVPVSTSSGEDPDGTEEGDPISAVGSP